MSINQSELCRMQEGSTELGTLAGSGTEPEEGARPDDLVTVAEAASMADRGVSTVRSWVRRRLLTGWKEDEAKQNSALLVSRQELMAYLAMNGKASPPRAEKAPELSASLAELQRGKAEAEGRVLALEREVSLLRELLGEKQELVDQARRMESHLSDARRRVRRF